MPRTFNWSTKSKPFECRYCGETAETKRKYGILGRVTAIQKHSQEPMDEQKLTKPEDDLVSFVLRHIDEWRNDLRANYYQEWDKYERMWLGVWDAADKTRTSERSKIISPDTQQAIESYEAEMVEATE